MAWAHRVKQAYSPVALATLNETDFHGRCRCHGRVGHYAVCGQLKQFVGARLAYRDMLEERARASSRALVQLDPANSNGHCVPGGLAHV